MVRWHPSFDVWIRRLLADFMLLFGCGITTRTIGKILSFSYFCVFCRISLSDPYSTSMANFACQNDLKDPKRAVKRHATFYSLSFSKYNKRKWAEFQTSSLKKRHSFETTACTLQLNYIYIYIMFV